MPVHPREARSISTGQAGNHSELCQYVANFYKKHVKDYFGPRKLSNITPKVVEDWQVLLLKKLAPGTVTQVASILKIMLDEAAREGLINNNPCKKARNIQKSSKQTGILTREEVLELFDIKNINVYWKGYYLHYAINLLAASTGMRKGEIMALRPLAYHKTWIEIKNSYSVQNGGLGPVKTKEQRNISIPKAVSEALDFLLPENPEHYIFSTTGGEDPIQQYKINRIFDAALKIMKVEKVERNIKFHSWRHWFNTTMRERGIPYNQIQAMTGHKSAAMTDHYTHFNPLKRKEIIDAQELLLGGINEN